jgi:anti-sigma B factor antagonist
VDLELSDVQIGAWHVLEVHGELDLHTSTSLRDRISELTDDEPAFVALDLAAVPFMDSSSLGVIVTALKRLRERGGELALIGVSGSPAKVLSITGMDQVIPMVERRDDLPER